MKLNLERYRDKVNACWIGKNIGGTIGAPYEGTHEVLDIKGFATQAGEPLPNDDLDLQLIWLYAMERVGAQVLNASVLAEYWEQLITPHWNEYGIGKANARRGMLPPLSGDYNNNWKDSNGAWIRTEIWASLCPGDPAAAVKYAVEDAMVDHGTGEGTVAAAFVAAMQSAAFVVEDVKDAIAVGLAAIPHESRVAKSIRLLLACREQGMSAVEARNAIQKANADIGDGWFEAPSNVAYTILGLLYGEGDFKRSVILATNCGDDTDCTAATVGATLGILGGMQAIPADWKAYIGDRIITISIAMEIVGSKLPKNCGELTDRVVALAPSVLQAQPKSKVSLCDGADEIPADIVEQFCKDPYLKKPLVRLVPNSVMAENLLLTATVIYHDAPEIAPGEEKTLTLRFYNKSGRDSNTGLSTPHNLTLRWLGCENLSVQGRTSVTLPHLTAHSDGTVDLTVTVRAGERVEPVNRLVLEILNEGMSQILYLPVVFLG